MLSLLATSAKDTLQPTVGEVGFGQTHPGPRRILGSSEVSPAHNKIARLRRQHIASTTSRLGFGLADEVCSFSVVCLVGQTDQRIRLTPTNDALKEGTWFEIVSRKATAARLHRSGQIGQIASCVGRCARSPFTCSSTRPCRQSTSSGSRTPWCRYQQDRCGR